MKVTFTPEHYPPLSFHSFEGCGDKNTHNPQVSEANNLHLRLTFLVFFIERKTFFNMFEVQFERMENENISQLVFYVFPPLSLYLNSTFLLLPAELFINRGSSGVLVFGEISAFSLKHLPPGECS